MSSILGKKARRASALVTVLAMTAFIVQLAIPATAAAPPPDHVGSIFPVSGSPFFNNFPDSSGATKMNLVSDKAGPADLTAISTHNVGATQMTWFDCAPGTGPGPDTSGNVLDPSCVQDGQDTTPTLPAISGTTTLDRSTIDEAWSIAFDVPARLAGIQRDLVAVGCNGTPLANGENCTADTVNTWFDDSAISGVAATSSGTITSITPSFSDTAGAVNGVAVSAVDGFDATAMTSSDLTQVAFALDDSGVTAATPQGDYDVDENSYSIVDTPDSTTATTSTWSTTDFEGNVIDSESTAALTLASTGDGSFRTPIAAFSSCAAVGGASCAMDRVYLVGELGSALADHTFLRQTTDVTADPTCTTGPTTISAPAGSLVNLTGCVINAFDSGVAGDTVNWRVNDLSIGNFVGQPDPVTDANGYANATVTGGTNGAARNLVVTFCADENNNGVCDGSDVTSQFQITWTAAPSGKHSRHVSLKLGDSLKASGKVTVPDGFGACASRVPVKVQRRSGGAWRTMRMVKTSATGAYHAKLRNRHGSYRALAPKVTRKGAICKKAISPPRHH